MATIYKYSILITFAHPNPNLAVLSPMSVGYNPTKADTFKFNKKSIRIRANRARKIQDTSHDLFEVANSLNNQIQKAVEFYYITCPVLTRISSIDIRYKTKTTNYTYQNSNTFIQPLAYGKGAPNPWCLQYSRVADMLQFAGNGPAYRNAISYCLRSIFEEDVFAIFSLLWRAFNALYSQHAGSPIDAKGLNQVEKVINNNYNHLTLSSANIIQYRNEFKKLRWNKFILNKVAFDVRRYNKYTHKDGIGTRNFLTHYFDGVINDYFDQLLTNNTSLANKISALRGTSLLSIQLYQHANGINNGLRDIDILVILVKDYAYFLRNTLFHGAVDEPSFTLGTTQEQKELKMASEWLENLIKDLLNNQLI